MKKTIYALSCIAMATMMASCGSNTNKKAADNTAAEADEWIVLFDGETFDGWRGYNRTDMPAAWTIEDGAIKINGSGMGEAGAKDGGDIIFDKKLKDIEQAIEMKVDKSSNSRVF